MGAFGSCLGVGRPMTSNTNPRLLGSNLVSVDAFGAQINSKRPAMMVGAHRVNSRHAYLPNGPVPTTNGQTQMSKPLRQTSSLSQSPGSHQHTVPKLVDIDDNPLPPFDQPSIASKALQNSHLICNRKQQAQTSVLQQSQDEDFKVSPNEIKVFIALFPYEPKNQEDLGFDKGEHLETAAEFMNGDWWYARSKTTRMKGYIPSNYVTALKTLGSEAWYFGKIGRAEAEARLKMPENQDGAFMIRDSDSDTHRYSLSLRHDNDIKHYRIRLFHAGGYFINKKTVFSTIHDLVAHYSAEPDGLCINLVRPCILRFDRPMTSGLAYDPCDQWEIDRNRVTLSNELGRGQFGQVYEGLIDGKTRVAIKQLRKGSMDPQDFLAEAQIMKNMKHENLVQLFAVCTREEPVYIVTELMPKGALISYLQTDEGKNLPLSGYIKMATQIAAGMSYIEREKYVHRDLAARNILVGVNNVCKIADFGLARFITEKEYEARVGAKFPIKWTAPEAANFSKFTIKSDVWSFGIVLYEIITKGGIPYPEMSNQDVLERIEKGYRMPQPTNCETKYYGIMVECWNKDPNKRPTFDTLHWKFTEYFTSDEQYREANLFRDR